MNQFILLLIVLTINSSSVNSFQNRNPNPLSEHKDVRGDPPVIDPDGPRSVYRTGYYGQFCNNNGGCGGTPLCKTVQDCLEYNEDWGDQNQNYKSCVSIARVLVTQI